MKRIIIAYVAYLIVLMAAFIFIFVFFEIDINKIYQQNIRGTLFTAFLTMGSFTLSLMTMFMFSLKDKLFDDEDYKKRIDAYAEIENKNSKRYKQLVNISRLFLFCVFCCFCTSISQFTIGLVNNVIASNFCMSIALSTLSLALYVLIQVWKNLEIWFNLLLKK